MGKITRAGIALDDELLEKFDEKIKRKKYKNRSEAIRDLIRANLVEDEWKGNRVVVGTITLVYDHHVRELSKVLTHEQHESHAHVIAAMHVHLDERNCLEVIVVKGRSAQVQELADTLIGTRGVLHGKLIATSMGQTI
jgi:CopG family transcriptional regulator, nickel-responsive regulator